VEKWRSRYEVAAFRVIGPVTIALIMTTIYIYLSPSFTLAIIGPTDRVVTYSRSQIDNLFDILSVIYAVSTAFLLLKGLGDHAQLKLALNEEAGTIRSITHFTSYFTDHGKDENTEHVTRIRDNLIEYIKNLITGHEIAENQDNDEILEDLVRRISQLESKDHNDHAALSELMKEFNALLVIRSKRQALADSKMSPYLLFLMATMSLSIISSFFIVENGTPERVAGLIVFALSFFMAFVFITMFDISRPFVGFWQIKLDSFEKTLSYLESERSSMLFDTVDGSGSRNVGYVSDNERLGHISKTMDDVAGKLDILVAVVDRPPDDADTTPPRSNPRSPTSRNRRPVRPETA